MAAVARVSQGSARSHTIGKLDLDSVSSGGFSSDRSHPAQQGAAAAEASTYFRSILPLVLSRTGAALEDTAVKL